MIYHPSKQQFDAIAFICKKKIKKIKSAGQPQQ